MTMPPRVRQLALTAHVVASVGWLGAVTAFLALAVTGLHSSDENLGRASYVAMEVVTRAVIWPLCLASLATGILQAMGTPWGLFRHYWVVGKLLITAVCTVLLVFHTGPIAYLAAVASENPVPPDLRRLRTQLVADAGAAILALVATTALSIYKPLGMIGRRRTWVGWILATLVVLLVGVVLLHLAHGGMAHH